MFLDHAVGALMVQMAIVSVVDMAIMLDPNVSAIRSVLMVVILMSVGHRSLLSVHVQFPEI